MLTVLVLGTGVLGLSLLIGCLFPRSPLLRAADQLIVTVWVGLLVCSVTLLALSMIMPLGNGAAAGVVIAAAVASGSRKDTRQSLRSWARATGRGRFVALFLLMLGMAVLASSVRPMGGDYGGYHYPLTLWFTEIGTVPGLGLLHHRFATPASWWTINALYNVGGVKGRVEPILGYSSVILISCHVVITTARCLKGSRELSDWFLVVCFALMAPYLSGMLGYPDRPFSDRADMAVAILGLLVAWLLIAFSETLAAKGSHRRDLDPGSLVALIILAAGAVTLKLSALPILVVAWLFSVSAAGRPYRTAALSTGVALLVLSPVVLSSLTTTGCILFPSAIGCLELPWAIGPDKAKWYSSTVTNWARWTTEQPQGTFSAWLGSWFVRHPLLAVSSLASVVFGGAGLSFSMRRRDRIRPWIWPVGLGVAGLVYGIVLAPTLRFLMPYLMLIPALTLLWIVYRVKRYFRVHAAPRLERWTLLPSVIPALMLLFLFALPTEVLNVRSAVRGDVGAILQLEDVRWLSPYEIRSAPSLEVRRSNDVRYVVPVNGQCGGAPLPCTPFLTHPDIRLRSPDQGLAGGFVR
jgi:hypothetical protein